MTKEEPEGIGAGTVLLLIALMVASIVVAMQIVHHFDQVKRAEDCRNTCVAVHGLVIEVTRYGCTCEIAEPTDADDSSGWLEGRVHFQEHQPVW